MDTFSTLVQCLVEIQDQIDGREREHQLLRQVMGQLLVSHQRTYAWS